MKLHQIVSSQAVRFVDQIEPENKSPRSPTPIVRAMEDRYGFVQVPRTLQEFNFNTGVTFLRGFFKHSIIDRVQVYERGFLCEGTIHTDICDEFLDDLSMWAIEKFELPVKENALRTYFSQIEVVADLDIGAMFSKFLPIGRTIIQCLRSYGQQANKNFEISGLRMHGDITQPQQPPPAEFIFERRAGQPYDSKVYFSVAPLRSDDHMRVLNELEALF
jgi:hypothetical protein